MRNNGTDSKKGSGTTGGKVISAFCSVIGTIGVILIIVLCVPVTIPSFVGEQIYNVVSGSMEPELPVGSIIYAQEVDPLSIVKGDIVVYQSGGMTVTHRVVEVDQKAREVITKGDANAEADPIPVKFDEIKGCVQLHFPFMGMFFEFFTSLKGKIYLMGILVACFVLMIVGGNLRDKANKKATSDDEEDDDSNADAKED